MSVNREMEDAVKFVKTHLEVMIVLVKRASHWTSMALTALVSTRFCRLYHGTCTYLVTFTIC